jgi:hypothetical protein
MQCLTNIELGSMRACSCALRSPAPTLLIATSGDTAWLSSFPLLGASLR